MFPAFSGGVDMTRLKHQRSLGSGELRTHAKGPAQSARHRGTFALAAIFALAIALAPEHAAAASGKCKLLRIAEWPVKLDRNRVLVQGEINGQPIDIQLDTGADRSLILRSAAVRLGLAPRNSEGNRMFGIGGETRVEEAYVDELRIGGAVNKGLSILVAGEHEHNNVALLLGADFFENVDVEFDLPHKAVRLYQSRDCGGVPLAYWADGGAAELPMEPRSKIVLPVKINGEPMRAMLDSGAATSIVAADDARRLGVTPETPGVVSGRCSYGIGKKMVDSWIGQFRSFEMDTEVIHEPKIDFAELWRHTTYTATGNHVPRRLAGLPEMLLGVDFLRAHRVLIAHSQRKVYFTYTGGPVFFTRQGKPCSETAPDQPKGNERTKD